MQHAREGNGLAHMLQAANPGHGALNAHAEARMRHGAVTAQIEIPLEGLFAAARARRYASVDRRSPYAAAANDFAITFGRQHIDAQRQVRPRRIRLHVERLHLGGIAMNQTGRSNCERVVSSASRSLLPTGIVFNRPSGLPENLHRLVVSHAREGRRDLLQLLDIAADICSSGRRFSRQRVTMKRHQSARPAHSSSRSAYATSGSTIQNSVRWRRVFDFPRGKSARSSRSCPAPSRSLRYRAGRTA